jgi:hypothetical protein
VGVSQERMRIKRRNWLFHTKTVFHQGGGNKSKAAPGKVLDADQSQIWGDSLRGSGPNYIRENRLLKGQSRIYQIYGFLYVEAGWLRKFI